MGMVDIKQKNKVTDDETSKLSSIENLNPNLKSDS